MNETDLNIVFNTLLSKYEKEGYNPLPRDNYDVKMIMEWCWTVTGDKIGIEPQHKSRKCINDAMNNLHVGLSDTETKERLFEMLVNLYVDVDRNLGFIKHLPPLFRLRTTKIYSVGYLTEHVTQPDKVYVLYLHGCTINYDRRFWQKQGLWRLNSEVIQYEIDYLKFKEDIARYMNDNGRVIRECRPGEGYE